MIVRECMTQDPLVVRVNESVESALAKLREADVRHLPVTDNGRLVGILSDRDLRRALDLSLGGERAPELDVLEQPVSELMSSDVISVNPETELVEVIDLMLDHKIGAIPVVEYDSPEVIGIISYIDLLRIARPRLS